MEDILQYPTWESTKATLLQIKVKGKGDLLIKEM